jgi:2-phospho-L-lactate guanylyltransferase (CobY/MobA/RfbA family)
MVGLHPNKQGKKNDGFFKSSVRFLLYFKNTNVMQFSIPVCRQMHNTETMLQERLAAEVNYATDPQELSRILVAMQDMPNIDRQKIDDAFDVMRIAVELSK